MKSKKIIIERENGTGKILLNRPDKRNSLDEEMIGEITKAISEFETNKDIKCIIITGAGGNFCSGLYLDYLQKISEYNIIENKIDSSKFKNMLLAIYNCPKPVIAMVDGFALAGGCGIASACDMIICSDKSQFGYTEVKIGFIPAIVMVFLLKKVSETHAKELLITSKFITGEEAFRIGLVNQVVPQQELEKYVKKLCDDICKLPGSSIRLTKEMFRNISSMSFDGSLEYAVDLNAITRMTDECKHGIMNFLSKSKTNK
ncbi:MAG: Crotonyl-CoA hydratase [Ignavibacteria bacterium]|nr:Crotonyl-CoA hydratase [Ignavibacteria bacterium]